MNQASVPRCGPILLVQDIPLPRFSNCTCGLCCIHRCVLIIPSGEALVCELDGNRHRPPTLPYILNLFVNKPNAFRPLVIRQEAKQ